MFVQYCVNNHFSLISFVVYLYCHRSNHARHFVCTLRRIALLTKNNYDNPIEMKVSVTTVVKINS